MIKDQPPIKTIRSIIEPLSLLKLVKLNYASVLPDSIRLLSVGDNDHYLINAQEGKYILRVYRYNKHWLLEKTHYLFEIDLLQFLHANNIPVSYPIRRIDENFIGELQAAEGIRYWSLFSLASGEAMQFTYQNCYNYGNIIAKFHHISNRFNTSESRFNIDTNFLLELPLVRIKNYLDNSRKKDQAYLVELVKELQEIIVNFNQQGYINEWGIIGGDFHGGNHFCDKKGDITLFDFDLCGYGWRTYDLAVFKWALFYICRRGPKVKNRQVLWQAFLEGYNSLIPLKAAQLKVIPAFVQARQIWLMGSETTYIDKVLGKEYWDAMLKGLKNTLKSLQS